MGSGNPVWQIFFLFELVRLRIGHMASHTDPLFSAPNLPNGPELKKAVAITIKKHRNAFYVGIRL